MVTPTASGHVYPPTPPPPLQLLTVVFVARGEAPLADGVVGGEPLFGDGVVGGDGHGQDAGVGDHAARGRLAAVPADVGTHCGWRRGREKERGKEQGR